MIRTALILAICTSCASDYKVHSAGDGNEGAVGDESAIDTASPYEDTDEPDPIDPDAPVAVCTVTPDKVRPITQDATWIGRDSYDPNDLPITYSWTLVYRPVGSAAVMPSGASADRSGFTTDLAGEYVGRLVVTNSEGIDSDPCEVSLDSEPAEALWVEMFWENSGDDMDLHLLAPGGTLETDTDCYYGNCTPGSWTGGLDWGIPGDTSDDPTLDLDDISLTGPENINIEAPENSSYTVIVHDYPGSVFEPANAVTINIYLNGSMEWSDTRMISGEGSYTEFALIDVAAGEITSL
ncbi:MAG: hypothetical protein CL930_04640 [Deltaproteobacteria bacterium]|jgi:hypothetical protein|nr:hypothetical protein [Deltaproteobacteria bacterium]|tara:strand:+ start:350 stop:1234 length:885 start_codon:yes stop_codon:yes gene_type:complete